MVSSVLEDIYVGKDPKSAGKHFQNRAHTTYNPICIILESNGWPRTSPSLWYVSFLCRDLLCFGFKLCVISLSESPPPIWNTLWINLLWIYMPTPLPETWNAAPAHCLPSHLIWSWFVYTYNLIHPLVRNWQSVCKFHLVKKTGTYLGFFSSLVKCAH